MKLFAYVIYIYVVIVCIYILYTITGRSRTQLMNFPDIPLMWTSLQGTNIIGMGKVLQLGLVKTAMVCGEQINRDESGSIKPTRKGTWWLIPLSKWVITPVINGISKVNPHNWGYNPLTKWDEPPSIYI